MNDLEKALAAVRAEYAAVDAERATEARKTTEKAAREWLATLDPESTEGAWFEALAKRYPSRLAAAIEYVATVQRIPPR